MTGMKPQSVRSSKVISEPQNVFLPQKTEKLSKSAEKKHLKAIENKVSSISKEYDSLSAQMEHELMMVE